MTQLINNNQDVNFDYKNLVSANSIVTMTQDTNDNLYYAAFDKSGISEAGEKIYKYNMLTKQNEIYWAKAKFKVGSFKMVIDIKGNIYLSSAGGIQILNNGDQASRMPLVGGMITDIVHFKDSIYATGYNGFYKYNINTKTTEQIILPNNSIATSIFIDKNENIYLGVYKPINYSVLVIKKGEFEPKPLMGDDFFNTNNLKFIAEIDNKLYFYILKRAIENENVKLYAKLYYSDLNNLKVNYLLDLSINVEKIFNLNHKVAFLIQQADKSIIIETLDIKNMVLKKEYERKNSAYNKIIQNAKKLYLSNENKIDCLSW